MFYKLLNLGNDIAESSFFINDLLMGNKTVLHLLANKDCTKNGAFDFIVLSVLYNNKNLIMII